MVLLDGQGTSRSRLGAVDGDPRVDPAAARHLQDGTSEVLISAVVARGDRDRSGRSQAVLLSHDEAFSAYDVAVAW
jgi:hypothetical protein